MSDKKTDLRLLPRKEFELVLSDGTVHAGKFGTWALAHFSQKKKLSLAEAAKSLGSEGQMMDFLDFICCAVEYKERMSGAKSSFNTMVLAGWMDDYSIDHGTSGFIALINHSAGEDEKKTEQGEAPSDGENLSDSPTAQG